jgi:hypothetical protein
MFHDNTDSIQYAVRKDESLNEEFFSGLTGKSRNCITTDIVC